MSVPADDPVLLAIQKTAGNQALIRAIKSGLIAPPSGSADGVRG